MKAKLYLPVDHAVSGGIHVFNQTAMNKRKCCKLAIIVDIEDRKQFYLLRFNLLLTSSILLKFSANILDLSKI